METKPLFQVKLIYERMPLLYKGHPTWYSRGDVFDVLEIVERPIVGKCYRLAYKGFEFDGVAVINSFEVIE